MIYKQWFEQKHGKYGKVELIRYRVVWFLFIPIFYSRVVLEYKA